MPNEMTPDEALTMLDILHARLDGELTERGKQLFEYLETILQHIGSGELQPIIHAHWIAYKRSYLIGQPGIDEYKCSNCGCRRSVKSKYCKDCGALMDESDMRQTQDRKEK